MRSHRNIVKVVLFLRGGFIFAVYGCEVEISEILMICLIFEEH